ncbi:MULTISPECIES: PadR family transcriptional regulator [unclassified Gilvimarinus]|uniref:PadR family transcriptional regulator n=1 Tax=unclassified Gilvimarinus TaxID=2642066 RepID=UPI0026E307BC|nr:MULTISPECIES: PadR family transcriptional regulator [unclassified Gilvimarinus]MDO6570203.1 PadR family transcriptional regulator [Gilvimarinus sp. 2_MG-2023]MDO6748198.1 PadR family transcriptional regulator [Gilvimarinus sp. 1_MG-2023]
MSDNHAKFNKLTMELRRGLLVMAVLEAVVTPHYGYSLRRHMEQNGLTVDEGTLYPLLRRLESQELLTSDWQVQEGRKRRVYQLSTLGEQAREVMAREWQQLNQALTNLTEGAQ